MKILKYEASYKFGEKKAEQNMDKIYNIEKAVDKVSVELLFNESQCLSQGCFLLKMEAKLEIEEKR